MQKLKKFFAVVLCCATLASCVSIPVATNAATSSYKQQLLDAGFTQSYADKLAELHDLHPTWEFEPLPISYDWSYVIGRETAEPDSNLVTAGTWNPDTGSNDADYSVYRDLNNNELYDSGWYATSAAAVSYFMDPRNFLNEKDIFQFQNLAFNENETVEQVQSIISSTFMGTGVLENGLSYAQYIYNVASELGVSALHLASRLRQENGNGGPLVEGTLGTTLARYYVNHIQTENGDIVYAPSEGYTEAQLLAYNGYYNFFNIGAAGTGRFEIFLGAADEAVTGTASKAAAWGSPSWDTKWKAIYGGALKVKEMYIDKFQNTLYLQKFNVDPRAGERNFWGQYMQNISAPLMEGRTVYSSLKTNGTLENSTAFLIPVFSGMPEATSADPAGANTTPYSPTIAKYGFINNIDVPSPFGGVNVSANIPVTVGAGRTVQIVGWSLHTAGIQSFQYNIDGGAWVTLTGNSVSARADVIEANPTFADSCANLNAFSLSVSTSGWSEGEHIIVLKGITTNGMNYLIDSTVVTVNGVADNEAEGNNMNMLEISATDCQGKENGPASYSISLDKTSTEEFRIKGWSLHALGVTGYQYRLDNEGEWIDLETALRPDVQGAYASVYPLCTTVNAFNTLFDYTTLSKGNHAFSIRGITPNNKYYSVGTINLTVTDAASSTSVLTTSKASYDINEDIIVNATSENNNAIVGLYLKSDIPTEVTSFYCYYVNSDDATSYSGVDVAINKKSVNMRAENIAAGEYTVVLFEDDGSVIDKTVDITLTGTKKSHINTLEYGEGAVTIVNDIVTYSCTLNRTNNDTFGIGGWSVHTDGVKTFEYSLDDTDQWIVPDTIKVRDDVTAAYPAYSSEGYNAFTSAVDYSEWSVGEHKVYIRATTNGDDVYQVGVVTVTVEETPVTSFHNTLDTNDGSFGGANTVAKYACTVKLGTTDQVIINGWSVHSDGVKSYQYKVGENGEDVALVASLRPDVAEAQPNYTNGELNAFLGEVDYRSWEAGEYVITVTGTTLNDEKYDIAIITVTVEEADVVLKNGFVVEDDGTRYYIEDQYQTDWQTIGEDRYYFAPSTGIMATGIISLDGVTHEFANDGKYIGVVIKNGFVVEDDGTRYYIEDQYQTGWQTIGEDRYYFAPSTGIMATGIISLDGLLHEFANDGKYIGTVIKNGLIAEGGSYRYYIEDIYQTGWWMVDDCQYYFSLTTGLATVGSKTMSGTTYEFDEEGKRIGDFIKSGFAIEDNGLRFYVNGTYQTGWQVINGKQYFFSLTTGLATTGEKSINGVDYEFSVDGKKKGTFVKNGFAHEDGGIRYYVAGKYQTGWQIINEKRYYFALTTGLATVGSKTLSGVEYTFAADGKMQGTFVKEGLAHEDGGIRFYINGKYQTGWQIINGKQYFFSLTTGIATVGSKISGGVEYIFAADGKMQGTFIKNGFANEDGGIRYYVAGTYQTGWRIINNKQYFFSITTGMATTGVKVISGTEYTFAADGKMSGTFVKNGWAHEDGGIRYYVDGKYQTSWQTIGEKRYYFIPTTGLMVTENRTIGGVSYVFNANGVCTGSKSGFVTESSYNRYYEDGKYVTGWKVIDENTYYFSTETGAMATGNVTIGEVNYIFGADGILLEADAEGENFVVFNSMNA